jgi:hypothetical protein
MVLAAQRHLPVDEERAAAPFGALSATPQSSGAAGNPSSGVTNATGAPLSLISRYPAYSASKQSLSSPLARRSNCWARLSQPRGRSLAKSAQNVSP